MRTLKQHLRKLTKDQYRVLRDFCHYSNNLYNYSLYVCKQYYEQTGQYIGYNQLWREVKENENAKLMPVSIAQQTVILVDKNFRSFFALLKRKQHGSYFADVHPPHFRKRGDVFSLHCSYNAFSMKKDHVSIYSSRAYQQLHGKSHLRIPFTFQIPGKVKQLTIKPFQGGRYFQIYYTYEEYDIDHPVTNKNRQMALDLGVNNLITGMIHPSGRSFIVNGKPLKSYNRWYNKEKARLQSELETKQHCKHSKRLSLLKRKRFWYMDNYMNQVVNIIAKTCMEEKIGTVVLGYNSTWKQDVNMGKVNNQKFAYIPHFTMIQKLTSKLEALGIDLITHEESYTSKCSFIDRESVEKHVTYLGKRVKRGLFRSANGIKINADVNGAGNILRKVVGDVLFEHQPIVGLTLNPMKRHIFS